MIDPWTAFQHPVTVGLLAGVGAGMAVAGLLIAWAHWSGAGSPATRAELTSRWFSWCWLIVVMTAPILLGAGATIVAVALLGWLCYREYARTVGIAENRSLQFLFVVCVLFLATSVWLRFDRMYFACGILGTLLIVIREVLRDQPKGFPRRAALGVFGYLLFGFSLGYLGMLTHAEEFRPLLLSLLVAVEANDVFGWVCGKWIGGPKLIPNTSPGKTMAGSAGAFLLTTGLVAMLFHFQFSGTALDRPAILLSLGGLVSALGQLGDLTLSAIKRDAGIKDFGTVLPGHGGVLDRFDSLVLVPPAVYHFLSYFLGPLGG